MALMGLPLSLLILLENAVSPSEGWALGLQAWAIWLFLLSNRDAELSQQPLLTLSLGLTSHLFLILPIIVFNIISLSYLRSMYGLVSLHWRLKSKVSPRWTFLIICSHFSTSFFIIDTSSRKTLTKFSKNESLLISLSFFVALTFSLFSSAVY